MTFFFISLLRPATMRQCEAIDSTFGLDGISFILFFFCSCALCFDGGLGRKRGVSYCWLKYRLYVGEYCGNFGTFSLMYLYWKLFYVTTLRSLFFMCDTYVRKKNGEENGKNAKLTGKIWGKQLQIFPNKTVGCIFCRCCCCCCCYVFYISAMGASISVEQQMCSFQRK